MRCEANVRPWHSRPQRCSRRAMWRFRKRKLCIQHWKIARARRSQTTPPAKGDSQ